MRWLLAMPAFLVAAVAVGVIAAPVPKDAGELPPPTNEQLDEAVKNLKSFGTAFHTFTSANNDALPNNWYSKAGKPLLSWRVLILQYIEETPLYLQFKLDEPWDSEHNKKLI